MKKSTSVTLNNKILDFTWCTTIPVYKLVVCKLIHCISDWSFIVVSPHETASFHFYFCRQTAIPITSSVISMEMREKTRKKHGEL